MIKEELLSRKQQATVVCHKKTCWLFRNVLHFVYSVETDDKWFQPTVFEPERRTTLLEYYYYVLIEQLKTKNHYPKGHTEKVVRPFYLLV